MSPPRPVRPVPAVALLALASLGAAAVWVLLSMRLDRQCSWMAVVAAADAAIVVRLLRLPPGALRALYGVLATLVAILAANWAIVASWLGRHMGLLPWESILKLGPELGALLVRLFNSPGDLAWMAAALVVAALASR
jgi:hypothetical protein